VVDCLRDPQSGFGCIATSELAQKEPSGSLIRVSFRQIAAESPEFEGIAIQARVEFEEFYLICNPGTVASLIRFATVELPSSQEQPGASDKEEPATPKTSKPPSSGSIKGEVHLKTIGILLNSDPDDKIVAEFDIRNVSLSAQIQPEQMIARGSLGDVSVASGSNQKVISVIKESGKKRSSVPAETHPNANCYPDEAMLEFEWETHERGSQGYPGFDGSLSAHMRALRYAERLPNVISILSPPKKQFLRRMVLLSSFIEELSAYFTEGPIAAALPSKAVEETKDKAYETALSSAESMVSASAETSTFARLVFSSPPSLSLLIIGFRDVQKSRWTCK